MPSPARPSHVLALHLQQPLQGLFLHPFQGTKSSPPAAKTVSGIYHRALKKPCSFLFVLFPLFYHLSFRLGVGFSFSLQTPQGHSTERAPPAARVSSATAPSLPLLPPLAACAAAAWPPAAPLLPPAATVPAPLVPCPGPVAPLPRAKQPVWDPEGGLPASSVWGSWGAPSRTNRSSLTSWSTSGRGWNCSSDGRDTTKSGMGQNRVHCDRVVMPQSYSIFTVFCGNCGRIFHKVEHCNLA